MRGTVSAVSPLLLRIFFQKPLANHFKDWYTFYDAQKTMSVFVSHLRTLFSAHIAISKVTQHK